MDRRPVIYGTVRQTDRLHEKQTHKEGNGSRGCGRRTLNA